MLIEKEEKRGVKRGGYIPAKKEWMPV